MVKPYFIDVNGTTINRSQVQIVSPVEEFSEGLGTPVWRFHIKMIDVSYVAIFPSQDKALIARDRFITNPLW
jgi:hypothetical protein